MNKSSSRRVPTGQRGWRLHLAIIGFVLLFLAYAIIILTEKAETNQDMNGGLSVRTDLMRDQACHVANATIMGNCTEEEIAALQRENEF